MKEEYQPKLCSSGKGPLTVPFGRLQAGVGDLSSLTDAKRRRVEYLVQQVEAARWSLGEFVNVLEDIVEHIDVES